MSSPSVHICRCNGPFSYLVVNSEKPFSCYVFSIDMKTGIIYYRGIPNIDLFPDTKMAIAKINSITASPEWIFLGRYLIGASIIQNQLCICYVKTDITTATVFGNPVQRIKSADFYVIPIDKEEKDLSIFEFPLSDNHFFCTGVDFSMPFPYENYNKRDEGFYWNRRWMIPFERCPDACIKLFQGYAASMYTDGRTPNITYIIRRSSLYPGVRYFARGQDSEGNTANECECDLIFSTTNETFYKTWRRGSAPVKWKTTLPTSVSAPVHEVSENPTEQTDLYFDRMRDRLNLDSIQIISLLNERVEKGETDLLNAFITGVSEAKAKLHFDIEFNQIDINKIIHETNPNDAMLKMFSTLKEIEKSKNLSTSKDPQKSILRFNCADSLDRTNLVTFYYALNTTKEFARIATDFKNPVVASEDAFPTNYLTQDAIEFLCKAFIDSGNIVSLIYTFTPAIKTGQIRSLMTDSEEQSSDTTITILRRYHNVTTDPQRQVMIEQWTSLNIDNNKWFWMDPIYFSFVNTIDHSTTPLTMSVFDTDVSLEREFIDSPDFIVSLPEPLILSGVSFYIFPNDSQNPTTLSISCGNNSKDMNEYIEDLQIPSPYSPQWLTYNFEELSLKSHQMPISERALLPCKFVHIKIQSKTPFKLGCIRLGVKKSSECSVLYIEKAKDVKLASSNFEKFLEGRKDDNLGSIQEVVKYKIDNGITDQIENNEMSILMKNPAVFDLKTRTFSGNEGTCAFCLQPSDSLKSYSIDQARPYRIIEGDSFKLCSSCASKVIEFSEDDTPLSQIDYKGSESFICTSYQSPLDLTPFASIFDCSLSDASIESLQEILNPTYNFVGWNPSCHSFSLAISLPSICELCQIVVLFDKKVEPDISILTSQGTPIPIKSNSSHGNARILELSGDDLATPYIELQFEVETDISLKLIQLRGKVADKEYKCSQLIKPRPKTPMPFRAADGMFHFGQRTHVFNFSDMRMLTGILVRVQPSAMTAPSSFIVVLLFKRAYVAHKFIIVPVIDQRSQIPMWLEYKFLDRDIMYDDILVYYLDRIPEVSPITFSFCYK